MYPLFWLIFEHMLTKSADLRQWEEVYKHAQVKLISLSRESKYIAEKKNVKTEMKVLNWDKL